MKVLFIDTVHPYLEITLQKHNYICHSAYNKSRKEIENIIENYQGIIIRSKFPINKKFINLAKNLKFVARAGVGLENIDVEYLNKLGILCFNSSKANSQAVAEHALGMLLMLFNNLNKADNEIRNGIWKRDENRGIELSGKKIAIIGCGNTGSKFIKLLEAFNTKIYTYDKYLSKYPYQTTMQNIFKEADIVSIHIPLNAETKHIVNKKFINQFRKPIYLINTSRGKCVCNESLIAGIESKEILGACLDVIENEENSYVNFKKDAKINKLISSGKVVFSPHIAGWSKESYFKIAKVLSEKIIQMQ